ncbi:MAG: hypothetical protein KAS63_05340 [Candidatus Heimdallarchaeota archaeon]|nr:hypothetical protein [Candidatus Heimdallarchaeota archaeon]MCK4954761.1 hypothetical protein [Candidatus Heimdallarchaeota archaeon]
MKIWSLENLELVKTIKAHSSTIIGVKPWKNYVISGGRDHILKKWQFEDNTLVEELTIRIPDMERFFISEDFIIVSNHDGLISVLNAEDFKHINGDVSIFIHKNQINRKDIKHLNEYISDDLRDAIEKITRDYSQVKYERKSFTTVILSKS